MATPKKKAAKAAVSVDKDTDQQFALQVQTLTVADIDRQMENWLNTSLAEHDPADVYLALKQMETAVELGIKKLKPSAFDDFGLKLEGAMSGEVGGHGVSITYPKRWEYSPDVAALKEQQAADLDVLQTTERANGKAKQVEGKGVLSITLAKGQKQ